MVANEIPRLLEPPRQGLRAIGDLPGVKRRILVYGGRDSWQADGHIHIMSATQFAAEVARGL